MRQIHSTSQESIPKEALNIKEFLNGQTERSILTPSETDEQIRFDELFAEFASKLERIVTFLAILELMRLQRIVMDVAVQHKTRGTLIIFILLNVMCKESIKPTQF